MSETVAAAAQFEIYIHFLLSYIARDRKTKHSFEHRWFSGLKAL